jgi:cellulose synthase/poly-beta-1,6-N-acetylglucosamine synthase-like glycosyltransferase
MVGRVRRTSGHQIATFARLFRSVASKPIYLIRPEMPKLSSTTITANEAANAADGIASVNFYDERIVVDGGSKDDTVAMLRSRCEMMQPLVISFGALRHAA